MGAQEAETTRAAAGSVTVETGRLEGPDGLAFFWREWAAPSPAAARAAQAAQTAQTAILFVHGLGEHSGRYEAFGRYFAQRALPVLAFDLRGHGQSGGPRGHVSRFDDYVRDVMFFRELVVGRHPGSKVVLAGHSMGGLIALATAEAHGEAFAAVVASAPLLGIAVKVPGWKTALGRIMAGLAPGLSLTNEIDPAFLARNPEVGRRYKADPLVGDRVTARWFVETNRAMAKTIAEAQKLTIPALLLQGTADRLVSPEATRAFADKLAGGDSAGRTVAFRSFDGWYHELFQEDERETAFAAIREWLAGLGLARANG